MPGECVCRAPCESCRSREKLRESMQIHYGIWSEAADETDVK